MPTRPPRARELSEAFAACDADDAVRAIIVTGAGRAFCAGADLARGGETFDRTAAAEYQGVPPERPWEKPARAIAPWDVRKPIIAAINGPAAGVGATSAHAVGHPPGGRECQDRLRLRAQGRRAGGAQHVDHAP